VKISQHIAIPQHHSQERHTQRINHKLTDPIHSKILDDKPRTHVLMVLLPRSHHPYKTPTFQLNITFSHYMEKVIQNVLCRRANSNDSSKGTLFLLPLPLFLRKAKEVRMAMGSVGFFQVHQSPIMLQEMILIK
jgi:hypothetical protein